METKLQETQSTSSKNKYSKSRQHPLVKKTIQNLNSVIVNKKLSFNNLWTSKINQDDPYAIQPLENSNENLILINILFNSILVFSKKINEMLIILLNQELNAVKKLEYVQKISVFSRSLMTKIRNFQEIKSKSFKLSKESLFEIKNLKDHFNMIVMPNGSESISKFAECLDEFYQDLTKHLAN